MERWRGEGSACCRCLFAVDAVSALYWMIQSLVWPYATQVLPRIWCLDCRENLISHLPDALLFLTFEEQQIRKLFFFKKSILAEKSIRNRISTLERAAGDRSRDFWLCAGIPVINGRTADLSTGRWHCCKLREEWRREEKAPLAASEGWDGVSRMLLNIWLSICWWVRVKEREWLEQGPSLPGAHELMPTWEQRKHAMAVLGHICLLSPLPRLGTYLIAHL